MVAVPELWSHFFIGRAKEGFSLNKVMTGYDGWSMERQPFTDATIPLLADGIKWLGYRAEPALVLECRRVHRLALGRTDLLQLQQPVRRHARAGCRWSPTAPARCCTSALNLPHRATYKDSLQLRSKPEAFERPYFIDTGKFPATMAQTLGPEIYFRPGRFLIGGEYYWQNVNSADHGNLWVNGGEVMMTWLTTGETRSYNTVGNYFRVDLAGRRR